MPLEPSRDSGELYLGRRIGTEPAEGFYLPSRNLTTHGACIGMTGSGKTGLCVGLLEEVALSGVPIIAIDPKGDLTNLALRFPNLLPSEFEAWVLPQEAERRGISVAELAAEKADLWRSGLAKWGMDAERIGKFCETVEVSIFTPGSSSGEPLSLLRSFAAPAEAFEDHEETLREEISGAVSALLGMIGVKADPMQSREHILLCQLIERQWRRNDSVSLAELVGLINNPPIERFGALSLETFYPAAERSKLAVALNNLLASPSFENWLTGTPLQAERLFRTGAGKPRIAVVYLAHLSDTERMFVVTLLLNEILGWVRGQSGTSSLRALLYFDEVFGYLPPHPSNPPSKQLIMTLLKQARAYGLGTVLVTQNPVDLDYKALSNCGTWMLGRLQTQQDRDRILDGLAAASAESGAGSAGPSRSDLNRDLAGLKTREFILYSARDGTAAPLESRWVMSYLAGPLTRKQIRALRAAPSGGGAAVEPAIATAPAPVPGDGTTDFAPPVPAGWEVRYSGGTGAILAPHLLIELKGPSKEIRRLALPLSGAPTDPDWGRATTVTGELLTDPPSGARFLAAPAILQDRDRLGILLKAAPEALAPRLAYPTLACEEFELVAQSGETREDFTERVRACASEAAKAALEKSEAALDKRSADLTAKRERLGGDLVRAEEAYAATQKDKWTDVATDLGQGIFALLGGKRGKRTAMSRAKAAMKRSMHTSAEARRAEQRVENVKADIAALEAEILELYEQRKKQRSDATLAADRAAAAITNRETIPPPREIVLEYRAILFAPAE